MLQFSSPYHHSLRPHPHPEDVDLDLGGVGVTSGASTPTQLTRRVIEHLEAL